MPKLTPNIPYDDLGDCHQIAEFGAAWVMESSESVSYLALSDFRPDRCGSTVVRQASFGDIEALAGELPMLSQRSYRIGSDQGIVVLAAAVIDRRYQWLLWRGRSLLELMSCRWCRGRLAIALGSGVLLRLIK
jgi:hypothetical protein